MEMGNCPSHLTLDVLRSTNKTALGQNGDYIQMSSLVPRPRGRREKWPGIHCLCMRENPHDFMGYHIPSFTIR